MLIWELVGAVVGAGLASGREIASFFSKYGLWGYAGILLAVAVLICLASAETPEAWNGRWPEYVWKLLLTLLLVTTGGAMLAGSGEIASLVLPLHGAYWWGMAGTFLLSWLLALKTTGGLAWVSRVMLCVFVVLICVGWMSPEMRAVTLQREGAPEALLRGASYGGFNAALLIPVLQKSREVNRARRIRAIRWAGGILLILLLLGNAALLRHPALIHEPMPFVQLLDRWGIWGYYLSAGCLYLAIVSTLTACLRGLGGRLLTSVGIAFVALLGFNDVVEHAYSLLGGMCCLMLVMAKFRNCSRKAFHSGMNML